MDGGGGAPDRGRARRAPQRRGAVSARRHRRGDRPPPEPADDHLRLRARPVRARRGGPLRARLAPTAAAAPAPAAARGGDRPGPLRGRHLCSGVLRRPAGRLPRGAQPGADRPRLRGDALVTARLRPHGHHHPRPGDAAQPDGLQGRHQQHPRRGHRRPHPVRLDRRRGPRVAAGRHLRRHPPDPDADRELGPHRAGRAAAGDRPREGQRRPARRRGRVRPGRPEGARARRQVDRPRRPYPALLGRRGRDEDPAPRLLVHRRLRRGHRAARRRPLLHLLSARPKQFETIQRNLSPDLLNEYIVHSSSAVFAVPPGASEGGFVGEGLFA